MRVLIIHVHIIYYYSQLRAITVMHLVWAYDLPDPVNNTPYKVNTPTP